MSTIIIETDSSWVRAGFAGEDAPSVVFPGVVGNRHPIQHGRVVNWDDWKILIQKAYDELGVKSGDYPVLFSEPPLNPKANREKLTQLVFDHFGVPAMYLAPEALLALYASGRTTGTVVYSEDDVTHITPIVDGETLKYSTIIRWSGKRDLVDLFIKLLNEKGHGLTDTDKPAVYQMLTDIGRVAIDYEQELQNRTNHSQSYTMSNGKQITITNEDFKVVETMFKPSFIGMEFTGISESTYNSIMKCDVDMRPPLYENIVLVGQNTMYPGMVERIKKEIRYLAPPSMKVKIIDLPHRSGLAWQGGSRLGNMNTVQQSFITRKEYQDSGPSIVHIKCNN